MHLLDDEDDDREKIYNHQLPSANRGSPPGILCNIPIGDIAPNINNSPLEPEADTEAEADVKAEVQEPPVEVADEEAEIQGPPVEEADETKRNRWGTKPLDQLD